MKTVFYRKVGRRYKPVSEYDQELLDAFPKGTHLVMCYPGGQSRRFNIDPNYAAMIAAGRLAEDAICEVIREKSALRVPEQRKPLTEKQADLWRQLSEAFGEERFALEWCSYREAAEAGVNAMIAEAEQLMENPTVRTAFEHFITVAKLCKQEKSG